jgi:hypothetical protein
MHQVALTQDTPDSAPPLPVPADTCQVLPFQDSASGIGEPVAEARYEPTAMHLVALMHEIPFKAFPALPGLGVGSSVHVLPFHRSASVLPDLLPTAMQLAGPVHETPDRLSVVGWLTARSARAFVAVRVTPAPAGRSRLAAGTAEAVTMTTATQAATAAPRSVTPAGW